MDTSFLESQVEVRNAVNAMALQIQSMLVESLKPYLGRKVVKVSDTWTVAVQKVIDPVRSHCKQDPRFHRFCFEFCDYSVWARLTFCVANADHTCYYRSVSFSVCTLSNRVTLESLSPLPNLRTDYSVQEIQQKRERLDLLSKEVSSLKDELDTFSRS